MLGSTSAEPEVPTGNHQEGERDRFEKRWKMKIANTAQFDDFDWKRTIGIGSFGRVVYATHKRSHHSYAIKILNKSTVVRMEQVEQTLMEKRILQSVTSKFLIDLRYVFKTNSNLFLVMPFIQGGELFTYMRNSDSFADSQVMFYAAQVVLAFEYLHAMDIVYRDLKPENVLLDCDGYLRMVDYGFAKRLGSDGKTYSFVGTPEYVAPEMLIPNQRRSGYGFSVDWWSLGVFVWELKSRQTPFAGDSLFQVFDRIVKGKYSLPKNWDTVLADLLKRIFQVDVTKRIGCGVNGSNEIKDHAWFATVSWGLLYAKKVEPPFLPQCSNEDVLSNYLHFEEKPIRESDKEEYAQLFQNF